MLSRTHPRPPPITAREAHLVILHQQGTHTTAETVERIGIARSTGDRALLCAGTHRQTTLGP